MKHSRGHSNQYVFAAVFSALVIWTLAGSAAIKYCADSEIQYMK